MSLFEKALKELEKVSKQMMGIPDSIEEEDMGFEPYREPRTEEDRAVVVKDNIKKAWNEITLEAEKLGLARYLNATAFERFEQEVLKAAQDYGIIPVESKSEELCASCGRCGNYLVAIAGKKYCFQREKYV